MIKNSKSIKQALLFYVRNSVDFEEIDFMRQEVQISKIKKSIYSQILYSTINLKICLEFSKVMLKN